MKKRIIICILFATVCTSVHGQMLQLTDKESGAPVPYASIIIKTADVAMVSDAMGKFSLAEITMPAEIIISHLGYERLTMWITTQTNQTIALTPKSYFLDDIVIFPKDERQILLAAVSQLKASLDNGIIAKAIVNQWSKEGEALQSIYQADGYLLIGGMLENFKPDNQFPYYQAGYLPIYHRIACKDTLPEVHRQIKGYDRIETRTLVENALYNYFYTTRFLWQDAKKADKYFSGITVVENGFMCELKELKKLEIYQQGVSSVSLLIQPSDSSILQFIVDFRENAYRESHQLKVEFSKNEHHIYPSYMYYTVVHNGGKLTLGIRPYHIGLKGFNLETIDKKYQNSKELDGFYGAINSGTFHPSYLSFEDLEEHQSRVLDEELHVIAKPAHINWLTGPYETIALGLSLQSKRQSDAKTSDWMNQRDLFIKKLIEVFNKKL